MSKNKNRTRKTAAEVLADAQAITVSGPIDHHSQLSSWAPPAQEEPIDEQMVQEVAAELDGETITAADVGSVEEILEPAELADPDVVGDDSAPEPTEEPEEQVKSFDQLVAALDPEKVDEMVVDIAEALDARTKFEEKVGPDNTSIHTTLKKVRAAFTASKDAARVMLVCEVKPDFINRSISEGARYNVYALGKFADIVKGLTAGQVSNAINLACMRSLFAFRAAGVPFTGQLAKAAASDKIRVDAAVRKHLVRHTVSESTASTQASSTMQALETLGIVKRTGTRNDSVYTLTDHPAVAKLEAQLCTPVAA